MEWPAHLSGDVKWLQAQKEATVMKIAALGVGQRTKPKADGVGGKRPARQAGPFDSVLTFLDVLLAGAAHVVESDNVLEVSASR